MIHLVQLAVANGWVCGLSYPIFWAAIDHLSLFGHRFQILPFFAKMELSNEAHEPI